MRRTSADDNTKLSQNVQKCQNSGIWSYIWNPYEKCIQKSPNMPDIGQLIREIDVKISENWETNMIFLLSKTNARILSVKTSGTNVFITLCLDALGMRLKIVHIV